MVTFLGNPVSFTGKQLQVGDKALDFSLDYIVKEFSSDGHDGLIDDYGRG